MAQSTSEDRGTVPRVIWGIIITFKVMPGIYMYRHERPRAEGTILETVGSNPHNHIHRKSGISIDTPGSVVIGPEEK